MILLVGKKSNQILRKIDKISIYLTVQICAYFWGTQYVHNDEGVLFKIWPCCQVIKFN